MRARLSGNENGMRVAETSGSVRTGLDSTDMNVVRLLRHGHSPGRALGLIRVISGVAAGGMRSAEGGDGPVGSAASS